jgi:antitoxin component of RelBE/YafQ-DinJ toxin-antitoxin module
MYVNERSNIMARDESVVKSFRISGDQFERANEIFKKEGFSLSEVIRLVCDATIREGRIPRG